MRLKIKIALSPYRPMSVKTVEYELLEFLIFFFDFSEETLYTLKRS